MITTMWTDFSNFLAFSKFWRNFKLFPPSRASNLCKAEKARKWKKIKQAIHSRRRKNKNKILVYFISIYSYTTIKMKQEIRQPFFHSTPEIYIIFIASICAATLEPNNLDRTRQYKRDK